MTEETTGKITGETIPEITGETADEIKRKPGGQKGNQNARIHGFYSKVLDAEQQSDLEVARDFQGLDDEIALLRVKIKSVVENDPENIQLIMRGIAILAKLVMSKNNLSKEDKQTISEGVGNVLKNIALPIGIGIASVFKK